MDFPPSFKTKTRYQFESFCKKVLDGERCDYFRELARRAEWESHFSDFPTALIESLYSLDDYEFEQYSFEVCGHRIQISNDQLAEALLSLGQDAYNILLLAYCLNLSDRKIGELLGQTRSRVQRCRQNLTMELRQKMKR